MVFTWITFPCRDGVRENAEATTVDIVGGVELVNNGISHMGITTLHNRLCDAQIIEKKVDFDICICTTAIYLQV